MKFAGKGTEILLYKNNKKKIHPEVVPLLKQQIAKIPQNPSAI